MSDTTKVNNWSFPFKPKEGALDPIQHLTAMAKAGGGYYPIGKNGQWHGGIHFDDKTAAVFDQSQVCCIADGEVIAYRIDKSYPKSLYLNSSKATFSAPFSRGFVLVKHRLEAPELAPREGVTPVPPPSLTFFSLYMHLLDWDSYGKTGAPTAPAFMGDTLYSVKSDKAVDRVCGLRVRAAPKNGSVTALLPKGTKVKVAPDTASSDWRKLLSIVEGSAIPALTGAESWVFIGEMQAVAGEPDTFLVADDANDEEPSLAPQKGLNVRKTGSGKGSDPKTGLLPVGAKFSLKAGTTAYRELQQIIEGQDVLPLSANSVHNIKGFVHFSSLDTSRSEPVLNQVHVLPKPYPIKAGELIGHLGQYQNHDEGSAKPLLHLEVFSCEDVPGFIAKSRIWATGLPDQQKTLLKVYKGASKLIPHREDISVSNPPKTSDAGTTVGVDLIIPQSLLDALPADHKLQVSTTVPGSSTPVVNRWWRLNNLLADSSGNPISGWLAEQEPITTRHSPWEWMGYDFIKETGRPIGKAAYFYDALRRLTDEEHANYRALASQEDQGPVKARLYDIIDTNRDNKLTANEICSALAKPWHAQSIAQLITHYESEWFWMADKWDELDPLMGHIPYVDPNHNWESEKARIERLSWWESLKGKGGISADGKAWHFQPVIIIGAHVAGKTCIPLNKAQEIALLVSTGFEGATTLDYEALADNFDGQGMSFGIIQWNFGQGTLGPVLQAMRNDNETAFDNCFDPVLNLPDLKAVLDAGNNTQQKAWAISAQSLHREAWKQTFKGLGKVESFQKIQLRLAANYHSNVMSCIGLMRDLSPSLMKQIELLTYVALYDLCVQQNNLFLAKNVIQSELPSQILSTQRDLLKFVCTKRAEAAKEIYVSDCLSRRLGIIQKSTYTATAHGITKSRTNSNYGLIKEGYICEL